MSFDVTDIAVRKISRFSAAGWLGVTWKCFQELLDKFFITKKLKIFASVVHATTGILALFAWRESFNTKQMTISSYFSRIVRGVVGSLWSIGPSNPSSNPNSTSLSSNNNASIWGLCTAGLLWFSLLPVISPWVLRISTSRSVPAKNEKRRTADFQVFVC